MTTLVPSFPQTLPEFTTKLDGESSFPIWLQEFVLKVCSVGTPRFEEYFKQGDAYFNTAERRRTKELLMDQYSAMLRQSVEASGASIASEVSDRDLLFENYEKLKLQSIEGRAQAICRLAQFERKDPTEFHERIFLQELTLLEIFILQLASLNGLKQVQIEKLLTYLASVHEGLRKLWDPKYFSETYKFTTGENLNPKKTALINMKPMITNIVSEYRSLVDYAKNRDWIIPLTEIGKLPVKQFGQKRKNQDGDMSKVLDRKPFVKIKKMRVKGNCINCGKPGHHAKDCWATKEICNRI